MLKGRRIRIICCNHLTQVQAVQHGQFWFTSFNIVPMLLVLIK